MTSERDVAECIAALWRLGPGGERTLFDAGGIVDQALEAIAPQLPAVVREQLSFYKGLVNRRCSQWPTMVAWLEETGMAERDGTTFTKLRVTLSREQADELLFSQSFTACQRQNLPVTFYKAVQHCEAEALASPR